jgi:hypothetical protein
MRRRTRLTTRGQALAVVGLALALPTLGWLFSELFPYYVTR